ncbi:MAG TPA: hypothetical protein PLD23_03645 [Armatimonadota bacterium]|nr:hypothetical protein [Armatimonadota bacterium]
MTAKTLLRYGLLLSLIAIPCAMMGCGAGPLPQADQGAAEEPTPLAEGSIADTNRDAAQLNLDGADLADATPMPLPGPNLVINDSGLADATPIPLPGPDGTVDATPIPLPGPDTAASPIDPVPLPDPATITKGSDLIEATPIQLP